MTVIINGTTGTLQNYDYLVPTTGFSYTFSTYNTLIMNPASALATGAITMPASPSDGITTFPNIESNDGSERKAYLAWLAEGNTPQPADE